MQPQGEITNFNEKTVIWQVIKFRLATFYVKIWDCNTQNKAVKNTPRLQQCVTWPVTHCNDEKTVMSFRKDKITGKIIFDGHMFRNTSKC